MLSSQAACSPERAPAAQQIDVEVVGCSLLDRDGVCTLDDERTLRAWVPDAWATTAAFRSAQGPLEATREATIDGGSRVRLTLPQGAQAIELTAHGAGQAGVFRLVVREPQVSIVIEHALALRAEGRAVAAASALRAGLPQLSGMERARAEGLLARIELSLGQVLDARASFERALVLDRAWGLTSFEMSDSCSLAFLLVMRLQEFEEAQAVLEAARAAALRTADGRARFPYFEALIALELGDLRVALARFRASHEHARRLGLALHEWTARDRIAGVLEALGRTDEAIAELEALQASGSSQVSACERADVLINLGWYYIEAERQSPAALERASRMLEQARALFPKSCADPFRYAASSTNLAYAAARLGNPRRAREYLSEARSRGDADGSLAVWWHELEGRIALADQQPEPARVAFERAATLAQALLLPELRWRALVGLGESLERLNLTKDALTAYTEAESVLDQHTLGVPLGEGRAAFLARHDLSAQAQIELALQLQGPRAAFALARHARARLLAALSDAARLSTLSASDRKRWTRAMTKYGRGRAELLEAARAARDLPVDQLTRAEQTRVRREAELLSTFEGEVAELALLKAPEPEHTDRRGLTLLYRPLRTGLVAFASDADGVDARTIPLALGDSSDTALSQELLTPFAARIQATSLVQVLTEGALAKVDFHALPFGDEPLIARVPVTYPLDLPPGPVSYGAGDDRALVVSDPTGDLPHARAEARQVSSQLRGLGIEVDVLEGDDATTQTVTSLLSTVSHIHFAGHAVFAGMDGWQSALRLARGETMSIGDVISTRTSARVVILSGCEAAQAHDGERSALGMATGFVLSGAQTVLAPTRTVNDTDTRWLMRAAYAASKDTSAPDWVEALRSAQLDMRTSLPAADWAAFRAITP